MSFCLIHGDLTCRKPHFDDPVISGYRQHDMTLLKASLDKFS